MSDDIRFTAKLKGGSDVARLLGRYPEKVGRSLESLVKQEARGLAVELARHTRPFGFSEKAKKVGEDAVAGDIGRVFALPSDAFAEIRKSDPAAADRFWANIQNRRFACAGTALIFSRPESRRCRRFARAGTALKSSSSSWKDLSVGRLDPKLHHASRNIRGEVTRHSPAQIMTSPKARENYIARIQKRVGFRSNSEKGTGQAPVRQSPHH